MAEGNSIVLGTVLQMREIVEGLSPGGLALMINPQWQPGNLVNDFGIGPWRRRSEDFVASFEEVYILKQMRIAGDNVRCATVCTKHATAGTACLVCSTT